MLSFLASLGIGTIVSRLAAAYEARQKAQTDQERIIADVRIRQLEAMAAVQAAEAGSRINAWVRAALTIPVVAVLWKILIFDKALGQWTHGRTDALSDKDWQVIVAALGFYFLYETVRLIKR